MLKKFLSNLLMLSTCVLMNTPTIQSIATLALHPSYKNQVWIVSGEEEEGPLSSTLSTNGCHGTANCIGITANSLTKLTIKNPDDLYAEFYQADEKEPLHFDDDADYQIIFSTDAKIAVIVKIDSNGNIIKNAHLHMMLTNVFTQADKDKTHQTIEPDNGSVDTMIQFGIITPTRMFFIARASSGPIITNRLFLALENYFPKQR